MNVITTPKGTNLLTSYRIKYEYVDEKDDSFHTGFLIDPEANDEDVTFLTEEYEYAMSYAYEMGQEYPDVEYYVVTETLH